MVENDAVDKLISESQPRSEHGAPTDPMEEGSTSSCDLIHVLYERRIINVGLLSGMLLEQ